MTVLLYLSVSMTVFFLWGFPHWKYWQRRQELAELKHRLQLELLEAEHELRMEELGFEPEDPDPGDEEKPEPRLKVLQLKE